MPIGVKARLVAYSLVCVAALAFIVFGDHVRVSINERPLDGYSVVPDTAPRVLRVLDDDGVIVGWAVFDGGTVAWEWEPPRLVEQLSLPLPDASDHDWFLSDPQVGGES